MKKKLIKNLLDAFSNADDKNSEGFKAFDSGVEKLKSELKQKIQVNTLDEVNDTLDKFKKKINLEPLKKSVESIREDFTKELDTILGELNDAFENLIKISDTKATNEVVSEIENSISSINDEIKLLQGHIARVDSKKPQEIPDFASQIQKTDIKLSTLINNINEEIQKIKDADKTTEFETTLNELDLAIKRLRTEMNSKGGGSMNRQIFIGGADPLTKYTDINLKAGSNVTITYANNNTTKKVDITIASSGGGSSVAGTVRSIASTSVSSTVGAVAGTDYVVLATAGVKVTLPTAVSNTNLYTIKNVAASSVLVAPDGVETIDTSANLILATQFTSVDLISDGVNWNIT
jgi:hypothetical protein